MHIHQGHWSLSSSAWWTLLCNNQLIYILPSTAICVDYWEKATCVRACVRVSALWDVICAHAPTLLLPLRALDKWIWLNATYTLPPHAATEGADTRTHARRVTDGGPDSTCTLPRVPPTPPHPPAALPFPLVGSSWRRSRVVKPSWVARLRAIQNVRPSVQPPRLCRAIFKGSKVWRHRLAAWQSCPRIPRLCQPWTGVPSLGLA